MNIECINFVYFSPTRTTKLVLDLLEKEFDVPIKEYDLTEFQIHNIELSFSNTDFVIFAFPVYSGRVPETYVARLEKVKGDNTVGAIIATYGNREYDDALLEMKNIASQSGFKILGAAAIVTEHSVVRKVGAGRPNKEDISVITAYGKELKNKIENINTLNQERSFRMNGNMPYRKYIHIPMAPKSNSACNACKACCKICPTGAIIYNGKIRTNKQKCIGCMRCVRICPKNARTVGKMKEMGANIFMKIRCNEDKHSEMFI
jgi:ferredoxin